MEGGAAAPRGHRAAAAGLWRESADQELLLPLLQKLLALQLLQLLSRLDLRLLLTLLTELLRMQNTHTHTGHTQTHGMSER